MSTTLHPTRNSQTESAAIDLSRVKLDPVWTHTLPVAGARRHRAVALCKVHENIMVASSNPDVESLERFLRAQLDDPYWIVQVEEAELRQLIRQVYLQPTSQVKSYDEDASSEIVDACDELINSAALRCASDIHLVPAEDALEASFRVDGILERYRRLPAHWRGPLISRIKVLAGLDIAEKRKAQDGGFAFNPAEHRKRIDIRVATIPTRYGERATLRLLTPAADKASLADLGMNPCDLDLFTQALNSSGGLILLTGPTGCGKSTTLYTAIRQLQATRRANIMTVEDPIEYEIPGISQVEVDSAEKVSFSRALRSILRHDPDIIMLGEIRDAETAEFAIKASLTGHLVLSTLHTNTAAGVVTRLVDMGVERFLVAATLRLALAQRLVRQLCPHCRSSTVLPQSDSIALGKPQLAGQAVYAANGCVYCAGKGWIGRTALFEMLPGGNEVSEMISAGVSETELVKHMRQSNRPRLVDDGISKLLSGTTTAQQVLSAVASW